MSSLQQLPLRIWVGTLPSKQKRQLIFLAVNQKKWSNPHEIAEKWFDLLNKSGYEALPPCAQRAIEVEFHKLEESTRQQEATAS